MNYRTSSLGLVMLGLWGCSGGTANPLGQGGTTGVSPGTGGASSASGGNAASGGATTAPGGATASGGSSASSGGATTAAGGSSALPTGGTPSSGGASNNTGGSSLAGSANTGGSGSSTGGATASGGGSTAQSGGSANGGSASGGTSAAGGGTSAGGAAGAAGGGAAGACPTGALFCEDFEKYPAGAAKAANGWAPETNNGSLQIDATHARGKQALHVHTDGNGRALIKLSSFSPPGNSFYGRMHLWVTAFPSAPNYAHYTLVELTGTGSDSIVRPIGGQFIQDQAANMWGPGNDKGATGDWTNWKPSAKAEAGKWLCMEWQMAAANNEIKIWINGESKTDLTVNTKSHGGSPTDFVFPTFNNIWFGWWLYQSGPTPNMFDLWIDDIALSAERLGCQ